MEIKTYKYGYMPLLFGLTKIVFCAFIFYQVTVIVVSVNKWLYLGGELLIIICWLIYLFIKVGIPFLKGKTALELDDEKLQYFVKELVPLQYYREVIYWRDVKDIEFTSLPRVGPLITFRITDGGNDASIYPKYIAPDGDNLYNTIQEYFKNSK